MKANTKTINLTVLEFINGKTERATMASGRKESSMV